MYRAQFRNNGWYNSLVLNHTVKRDPGGDPLVRAAPGPEERLDRPAAGNYAPADTRSRWMGSIAMDRNGNIALGYSLSGTDIYPTIAYAGRLAGDPAGPSPDRGGRALVVDRRRLPDGVRGALGRLQRDGVAPDGCTFWYTNEYLRGTTAVEWSTWIGAFRFPSCTPGTLRSMTFKSTGSLDGWVVETGETPMSAAPGSADRHAQARRRRAEPGIPLHRRSRRRHCRTTRSSSADCCRSRRRASSAATRC